MFERPILQAILKRLEEPRRHIQVLFGPRQSGKTTLARQATERLAMPSHYASADEPAFRGPAWLEAQWNQVRLKAHQGASTAGFLLVLDEVQKFKDWSETVKRLWDEDTAAGRNIKVLLLGSAPLLLQSGLTESLAGRFESIRVSHWTYPEMNAAFDWDLETFVRYGGYPGAAPFIDDHNRFVQYISDSLIETTLSKDILLLHRVNKPALLRQLFFLGCEYSGQILSFDKMLGQLSDAGNTTTLAHYLELLSGAGMLGGLQKLSTSSLRRRSSSPKLLALNTALITASTPVPTKNSNSASTHYGRLFETAVGAHLVAEAAGKPIDLYYWREKNAEVDFVLKQGGKIVGLEVKSGRSTGRPHGLERFKAQYPEATIFIVGSEGLEPKTFFETSIERLFEQ